MHRKAAIEVSEYNINTGKVSMGDKFGQMEGAEPQKAIKEGFLDLSIFVNSSIKEGEDEDKQYYKSNGKEILRGSMNTMMYKARIIDTIMHPPLLVRSH